MELFTFEATEQDILDRDELTSSCRKCIPDRGDGGREGTVPVMLIDTITYRNPIGQVN